MKKAYDKECCKSNKKSCRVHISVFKLEKGYPVITFLMCKNVKYLHKIDKISDVMNKYPFFCYWESLCIYGSGVMAAHSPVGNNGLS
jgi:hypothetical protein